MKQVIRITNVTAFQCGEDAAPVEVSMYVNVDQIVTAKVNTCVNRVSGEELSYTAVTMSNGKSYNFKEPPAALV